MDNQEPKPVQTRKGFIQVNISGFIWHPATEVEKSELSAPGDMVDIQPILYDIMVNADGTFEPADERKIPEGLAAEVFSVLHEVAAIVRNHKPDPNGLVHIGTGGKDLVTAPKPLLDQSGRPIITKH